MRYFLKFTAYFRCVCTKYQFRISIAGTSLSFIEKETDIIEHRYFDHLSLRNFYN